MTLLPRLILCLFALALLPAAPVHARMGAATAATAQAITMTAADSTAPCHEAPVATTSVEMHHGDAGGTGVMPPQADCCGDSEDADGDCGGTCPCPSAIPALAAPITHALSGLQASRDDTPVPAGRAGPNHTPPQRPPSA
jgi:hypothetical protein